MNLALGKEMNLTTLSRKTNVLNLQEYFLHFLKKGLRVTIYSNTKHNNTKIEVKKTNEKNSIVPYAKKFMIIACVAISNS